MPRLTIRYGDLVLHDGEVEEMQFTDSATHVSVSGKVAAAAKPASAAGLLDLLAGARKTNTQKMVEERRRELKAEQAQVVETDSEEEPTDVDA